MFTGIGLKIVSAFVFTMMAGLIRWVGDAVPSGEVVFARSFFALIPILIWLMANGELAKAFVPKSLGGHFWRSFTGVAAMFCGFSALARLPLPDVTAISYASPLIVVILAALVLRERVRLYRWSAVMVGLAGVMVMMWPHLASGALIDAVASEGPRSRTSEGALLALGAAVLTAAAMIQVRRLVYTESTSSIVLFFTLFSSALALVSVPFGWVWPEPEVLAALVAIGVLGGVGQILLTQSYRYADASLIAPFEYTSLLWAVAIGWFAFGDVPDEFVLYGGAIVVASGVYVIHRERQLGIKRARARKVTPPPA